MHLCNFFFTDNQTLKVLFSSLPFTCIVSLWLHWDLGFPPRLYILNWYPKKRSILECVSLSVCVSQCSASCGVGYQQRIVSCSLMPSSHSQHLYARSSFASKNCPQPHPPGTQPCLFRECPHNSYWKVGPWGKVRHKTQSFGGEKSSPANWCFG